MPDGVAIPPPDGAAAGPDADTPIRILIADDHAVVREGIRRVLSQADDLAVVAEAGSGAETLAAIDRVSPDAVILDVTMPEGTGLEVTRRLRENGRTLPVLILSMHDRSQYVLEAIRAGADGYVLKDAPPPTLREAVRTIARGGRCFPDLPATAVGAAMEAEEEARERTRRLDSLTPRETDVLLLIAKGRTNREIAEDLGISPRTVETHRESLMGKLEVRTIAGLTRLVIEADLDDAGSFGP